MEVPQVEIIGGLASLLVSGVGLVITVLLTIFWVWALIDCACRRFPDGIEKIVWLLVIFFSHCIGSAIYCIFGRPRGRMAR